MCVLCVACLILPGGPIDRSEQSIGREAWGEKHGEEGHGEEEHGEKEHGEEEHGEEEHGEEEHCFSSSSHSFL